MAKRTFTGDGGSSELERGLKKMRIGEDETAKEFTVSNILNAIEDVTNWKELGVQLKIKSSRLREIEELPDVSQHKVKMITLWVEQDLDANWEKLQTALESPAMCENRVTKGQDLEFDEASVRNVIVNIKSIQKQKLKLEEEWFKVDTECNWKTLNAAAVSQMMFLWITRDGEVGLSLSMPHSKYNWIKNKVFGDELIMAAKNDDLSTVEGALKFGVDPNTKELDEYRWTALLWACENGYSEIVDCLLEHGADVDAEDTSNWTTLILASRNGFLDIVRVLLDKNAGVNKKTNLHWTSLMWTARQGHVEVAKLLLERGADYTVQDKATFSPLIQASQDGHLGIVKVLVEYDSSPDHLDQRTTNDWTALMTSIKNEHEDISEFLMEKGCDVHNATKDGVTALHVASYRGLNNTVKNLCLRKKVKVDEQDEDGVTPLIFAAEQGNLDIVKTLVESGHADVNLPESENEWTAIFFAMESGHQNVLEYLLSSGRVNLKHEDTSEKTIVDLAKEINHTAFQYMLQCHTQETEAILSRRIREEAKPVDMNNYKSMLNRMEYKLAAKPGKEVSAGAA